MPAKAGIQEMDSGFRRNDIDVSEEFSLEKLC